LLGAGVKVLRISRATAGLAAALAISGQCGASRAADMAAVDPRIDAHAAQPGHTSEKRTISVDPLWGLMVFGGASAEGGTFAGLMIAPWQGNYGTETFIGAAVSRRTGRYLDYFTIDLEAGAGYRSGGSSEFWVAAYLRYDGFPWNHVIYTTLAYNVGLSYVSSVSAIESGSCAAHCTRLLHYLAPEVTFANPANRNAELVVRWHHRSGIFGAMFDNKGGSQFITAGLRGRY
jgi:hypothetical protein